MVARGESMLFNSIIFITIFLPIALIGWYGLQKLENQLYAKIFLVGMSLWFYGYYNLWYLGILLISVFINYRISRLFEVCASDRSRKALLWTGLVGNISLLFYFKYF